MKVSGGFYWESMLDPQHRANLGSGLRAAAALSALSHNIEFHTYAADDEQLELHAVATSYDIVVHRTKREQCIGFEYLHGCAAPTLSPDLRDISSCPEIHVEGEIVVRFGMLEGSAIVDAVRCVFDPQSEVAPEHFHANHSRAKHLAIVLNAREATVLTGKNKPEAAAKYLLREENCKAVIVKCGIRGAFVATPEKEDWIPIYLTNKIFTLGSGDIFTAAFAYRWAKQRKSALESARYASLATAFYCQNRFLPLPPNHQLLARNEYRAFTPTKKAGAIYLAAPFFSLGERWIVEQLRNALLDADLKVFSPLHDVGFGSATSVASADLRGLQKTAVVLALVDGADPGTIFEVGYARARGIPVVALSTKPPAKNDLTMLEGTNCHIVHDIATAIYRAGWLASGASV